MSRALPIRLEELADRLGLSFVGNPDFMVEGFDSLLAAAGNQASFCSASHRSKLTACRAGLLFVTSDAVGNEERNYIVCDDPELTFSRAMELLGFDDSSSVEEGIHPSASVHASAKLGSGVEIGAGAVIGADVLIGEGTRIAPGCIIGEEVTIGCYGELHPHAVIYRRCRLGDRVKIGAGAVIGGIGFGLQRSATGYTRHKHYGAVEIGDDVEIGSHTTVDRARWGMTAIGAGCKIDNQVQIAHNVRLGKHTVIAAQTGIAGSTQIGDWVVFGGKCAIKDNISIASGVILAACTAVSKSIKAAGVYSGIPASPVSEQNRRYVLLKNLHSIVERLKKVEETLAE